MATALHYTIFGKFFVVTIHFIGFAGARMRSRFPVHRTKTRALCRHARLSRTKRSDGCDDQGENQDERLNANHTIENRTPSIVFVPTVSADFDSRASLHCSRAPANSSGVASKCFLASRRVAFPAVNEIIPPPKAGN